VEHGILLPPQRIAIYLLFERFPIWLLSLDKNMVSHIWIMGYETEDKFLTSMHELGFDAVLLLAIFNNVNPWRITFTLDDKPKQDAIFLVSGSLEFVKGWTTRVPNRTLVLCDEHIWGQTVWGPVDLRWMRLRHEIFGGVTRFQTILGTNIPNFEPVRTDLRSTIQHVLNYSIKPKWCDGPSTKLTSHLTIASRLHPLALTTPVIYHTHYSATGWGRQFLTTDEIRIAFGLPAWA
jgi:hypothetical protein